MESKTEIQTVLKYNDGDNMQIFNEGDYVICSIKDGGRYIGRIVVIGSYQEREGARPEYAICINTSKNESSYAGEVIKIADIMHIYKIQLNDWVGYPQINEQQDKSNFISMIVALGYDRKYAEDIYENMKYFINLYNLPLSYILISAIREIDLCADEKLQNEPIEITDKVVNILVERFRLLTDVIRKSWKDEIDSQVKKQ